MGLGSLGEECSCVGKLPMFLLSLRYCLSRHAFKRRAHASNKHHAVPPNYPPHMGSLLYWCYLEATGGYPGKCWECM